MKPFNLERALAGDPVVTRDGRKVLELHKFNIKDQIKPSLIVLLEGKEYVSTFYSNGQRNLNGETVCDLFMDTKKVKYYMGVFKESLYKKSSPFGGVDNTRLYPSREQILAIYRGERKDIIIIEVEIEE